MTTRLCTTDADLNAALEIRFTVFVDEQKVPAELEADEYDDDALHLLLCEGQTAIGTARLVDKGNGVVKIGRVAILAAYRGKGNGNLLMQFALETARANKFSLVLLESQTYAIPFYEKLGFRAEGPEFDDAGIPHRRMILQM